MTPAALLDVDPLSPLIDPLAAALKASRYRRGTRSASTSAPRIVTLALSRLGGQRRVTAIDRALASGAGRSGAPLDLLWWVRPHSRPSSRASSARACALSTRHPHASA